MSALQKTITSKHLKVKTRRINESTFSAISPKCYVCGGWKRELPTPDVPRSPSNTAGSASNMAKQLCQREDTRKTSDADESTFKEPKYKATSIRTHRNKSSKALLKLTAAFLCYVLLAAEFA